MEYKDIIKNINILLADDDEDYLLMTYTFLKQFGYNVDKVSTGDEALISLTTKDYQIALLDYYMPGLTGEEVIKKIRETNKELIIILQTGFSGQKPPIETMQTLNIQNYYDKTEGIDRLNLELISAVKIFKQQSEIELSKYKQNSIGSLITGIAQELKKDLLSVSASFELSNLLIQKSNIGLKEDELEKLNTSYSNSKQTLESIDSVLTSLITQNLSEEENVIASDEVYRLINLIVKNTALETNTEFKSSKSLKQNSYIKGRINDLMFLICEIIKRVMENSNENDVVEFVFTEDEENYILNISSLNVSKLDNSFKLLIKMLSSTLSTEVEITEENVGFKLKK